MTILPAGNPLWLRSPGITQYGGDVNKKDYGGIGSVNSQTDINAAQFSRLTADLAAVARVAPLVRLLIIPSSSAPYAAVQYCAPAWAPPTAYTDGSVPPSSVYPTVTASAATSCVVTIPSAIMDDYGVSAAVHPRIVSVQGGVWGGTFSGNAFTITGTVAAKPVSITVW